ncbi:MAG: polymer-forming cytoskeletal protein [Acidobacteriota bacterium]
MLGRLGSHKSLQSIASAIVTSVLLILAVKSSADEADERLEQALMELQKRFNVDETLDGWELRPLAAAQEFRLIEIGHYRVSLDGVQVTGIHLSPLIGFEDSSRVFALSNRGQIAVDSVSPPAAPPRAGLTFSEPGAPSEALRLEIRREFEREMDRALLGSVESAALERLKNVATADSLYRELGLTACRDGSRRRGKVERQDSAAGLSVVCQDFSVASGAQEKAVSVIGGNLRIGGEVRGEVVTIAGEVSLQGTVEGDLWVFAGKLALGAHAIIEGDVYLIDSSLKSHSGSTIIGTVHRTHFRELVTDQR